VTEMIYRESFRGTGPKDLESVHMGSWPSPSRKWINTRLEEEVNIVQHISEAVASARQAKKIKLRQPVSEILIVSDKPVVRRTVKSLHDLLLQQTNAKHVRLVGITEVERLKRLIVEPNFKGLGPAFRGNANKVAQALRTKDGRELLRAFKADGHFPLKTDHEDYKITSEMVTLREEVPENYAIGSFDEGRVYVDLTIPADLVREGFVRDVIRRLQEMRKRLDLPVDAFADTFISVADPERLGWLEDERDLLMEEVRAKTLLLLRLDQAKPGATLEETWQVGDHELHMGLSQVTGKPQMVQA